MRKRTGESESKKLTQGVKIASTGGDVQILAGGAPVDSLLLVNVDNITIAGNGSLRFPLRAIGGGSGGVNVSDDGTPLGAFTTLNLIGMSVANAGGGQADVEPAVIYDDAVAADLSNIRANRAANNSPIDNTKAQITNLGSADGTVDPAAVGAIGAASTIGGGNDNSASGDNSTVPGGRGNIASGLDSYAEGFGTQATGPQSHAEGALTIASGPGSGGDGGFGELGGAHAEGFHTIASGVHSHAEGTSCEAQGGASHAEGAFSIASGLHAHAEGEFTEASGDGAHSEGTGTTASGRSSHAENFGEASADGAHAEGAGLASGDLSHAGGKAGATASGTNSFAHNGTASATDAVSLGGTASGVTSFAGPSGSASAQFAFGANGQASGFSSFAAAAGKAVAKHSSAFGFGGLRGTANEGEQSFSNGGGTFAQKGQLIYSGGIAGGGGGGATAVMKFGESNNQEMFLDDPLNPTENLSFSFRLLCTVTQRQGGNTSPPGVDYTGSIELGFNIKSLNSVATITGGSPGAVYGDPQVAGITIVPSISSSGGRPTLRLTLAQGGVVGPTHASAFVEWVQILVGNY